MYDNIMMTYLSEPVVWEVELDQVGQVRQGIRVDGGDATVGEEVDFKLLNFLISHFNFKLISN